MQLMQRWDKQNLRRLERKWRKSKLEIDRDIFRREADKYNLKLICARKTYYSSELEGCGAREFFRKTNALWTKPTKTLPKHDSANARTLADQFSNFFSEKIHFLQIKILLDSVHLLCAKDLEKWIQSQDTLIKWETLNSEV